MMSSPRNENMRLLVCCQLVYLKQVTVLPIPFLGGRFDGVCWNVWTFLPENGQCWCHGWIVALLERHIVEELLDCSFH